VGQPVRVESKYAGRIDRASSVVAADGERDG
jgi:hypothetical protein